MCDSHGLLSSVPTRPSQNSPERVAKWQQSRVMVGGRIRALRLEGGMTQETLALRSGVTRNVLIDVEHGKRGILYERLVDIAEALGVSAGELVTELDGRPHRRKERIPPGVAARAAAAQLLVTRDTNPGAENRSPSTDSTVIDLSAYERAAQKRTLQ